MSRVLADVRANAARWWIARNPMYLMSAVFMAVGAKLFLSTPKSRAGDVGLILLTLSLLQIYEWVVAAILLALHRARRAPEDEPSLLLLTVLFWTGPMAATLEMTAHRPPLGLVTALGACAIAWGELAVVRRRLGISLSRAGCGAAALCVLLLATMPRLLAVPVSADGHNELFLYAAWWIGGELALGWLPALRRHVAEGSCDEWNAARGRAENHEAIFAALTLSAMAAHLVAMNYAFFTHARIFYAAPLVAAVTAILFDHLSRQPNPQRAALIACALAPLLMVVAACEGFDPAVPVDGLPLPASDPIGSTLLLAAAAWLYGAARNRRVALLHAGVAALALVAWRWRGEWLAHAAAVAIHPAGGEPSRGMIAVCLYLIAAYLLLLAAIRRSREDAWIAAVFHLAGFAFLCVERTPAWPLHMALATGWTGLAATLLLPPGRRAADVRTAVGLLLLATILADFHEPSFAQARVHALILPAALLLIGVARQGVRGWRGAAVVAGIEVPFYAARGIAGTEHATASLTVVAAFLLLAVGAWISWNKSRWQAVETPAEEGAA